MGICDTVYALSVHRRRNFSGDISLFYTHFHRIHCDTGHNRGLLNVVKAMYSNDVCLILIPWWERDTVHLLSRVNEVDGRHSNEAMVSSHSACGQLSRSSQDNHDSVIAKRSISLRMMKLVIEFVFSWWISFLWCKFWFLSFSNSRGRFWNSH